MDNLITFNRSLDFSKISLGDFIKLGISVNGKSEGFWVRIIHKKNKNFKGWVQNHLELTDKIKIDDVINFSSNNIYSFEKKESSIEDVGKIWMALYMKNKYPDFYHGVKNPTKEELSEIEREFEREFNVIRK